nr:hypothetical protein [Tanacetum cinerariifolium]
MNICQYKDAKTLFEAIQARFGGNDATKKTQKSLLKQMSENFSAPSTESIDSIFNMLQKIISQLPILGETNSQKGLNMKFLRSLLAEWNTHVTKVEFPIVIRWDTLQGNAEVLRTKKAGQGIKTTQERLSPKNQESRPRHQDNSRKTVIVEDTSSKAMVAIDGAGLFAPPSIDLSNSGLEEFQHLEFKGYGPEDSKSVCIDTSNEIKKTPDAPIIKD